MRKEVYLINIFFLSLLLLGGRRIKEGVEEAGGEGDG